MNEKKYILPEVIREKRMIHGYHNATKFGKALGYTSGSIVNNWEDGSRKPSIETLVKMSELFGCTVDELLFGSEESDIKSVNYVSEPEEPFGSNGLVIEIKQLYNERLTDLQRMMRTMEGEISLKNGQITFLQNMIDRQLASH